MCVKASIVVNSEVIKQYMSYVSMVDKSNLAHFYLIKLKNFEESVGLLGFHFFLIDHILFIVVY